jgi:hypothetical protein
MATENKTTTTEVNIIDFINSFVDKQEKRDASIRLVELMQGWSSFESKMWESTIIGFGSYHYKYASGHEGGAPILGFSPQNFLLAKLNSHFMCIRQVMKTDSYLRV